MDNQIYGTSNNRLACTVNLILDEAGIDTPGNWVYDNGSVVKFEGLGETSRVSMIHPENVSNPTRYVSLQTFNEKFKNDLPIPMPLGKKAYVVRHGFADHNDPNASLEQAHDAHLTELGKSQARNSGVAILKDSGGVLPNLKAKCSDLVRTMETIDEILQQLPEEQRVDTVEVCIEARENHRAVNEPQHWKKNDPLTEMAIDPYISIENLALLAPGKSKEQLERIRVENCSKNDPIKNKDACTKKINGLNIDWSVYEEKLRVGYAAGKTFGQIATEKSLFEIIFEK
jgi:bisphosphoglycerate-dependent phosphoglycerate mutase